MSQPANPNNQQDYCINCVNPEQTYICRIVSDSGQTQGKQFLCIMNIAKEHGHDSCSATAQSSTCSGVLVQYDVQAFAPPPASLPSEANAQQEQIPPHEAQDHQKVEPRTLVEFTKQATTATKKGLKSAGRDTKNVFSNTGKVIKKTGGKIVDFTDDIGSNIKKATSATLKCITSLFFSCGGD